MSPNTRLVARGISSWACRLRSVSSGSKTHNSRERGQENSPETKPAGRFGRCNDIIPLRQPHLYECHDGDRIVDDNACQGMISFVLATLVSTSPLIVTVRLESMRDIRAKPRPVSSVATWGPVSNASAFRPNRTVTF